MNWLELAQKIQLIAQAGLTYSENSYDVDRYRELMNLVQDIFDNKLETETPVIKNILYREKGYLTPKVDVRAVIIRENKILMVHEKIDDRWSLPGGWADTGLTPFENAKKEVFEETGLHVEPVRLLAVMDKKMHNHPPDIYYCYKLFILCKEISGEFQHNTETHGTAFFGLNELPELSIPRNTKEQIQTVFKLANDENSQAICD